jgi:hypothetical protein
MCVCVRARVCAYLSLSLSLSLSKRERERERARAGDREGRQEGRRKGGREGGREGERVCVVYWYLIQYPLHRSGYASRSRDVVHDVCVCLRVNVCSEVLGLFSP